MTSLEQARKNVLESRKALLATAEDVRTRLKPAQLAEEALSLIDPELTLLGRIKSSVQHNRLLSLAILAGAGWLAGTSRRQRGDPRIKRAARTASERTTTKEKKNDSGNNNGRERTGFRVGREGEAQPQVAAQAQDEFKQQRLKADEVRSRNRSQAAVEPVGHSPQFRPQGGK
jgi:hypothetical protein